MNFSGTSCQISLTLYFINVESGKYKGLHPLNSRRVQSCNNSTLPMLVRSDIVTGTRPKYYFEETL